MASTIEVGAFTYDPATGRVSGPADYMRDRFPQDAEDIYEGRCAAFNLNAGNIGRPGYADSLEVAFLVAIQTRYAAYHGLQTFNAARGVQA